MKNLRYSFCREFILEYQQWASLRWRHHHDVTCTLKTVSSGILPTTHRVLNDIASYEKMNRFTKQTFNVKQ